jgi:hypothetical protein
MVVHAEIRTMPSRRLRWPIGADLPASEFGIVLSLSRHCTSTRRRGHDHERIFQQLKVPRHLHEGPIGCSYRCVCGAPAEGRPLPAKRVALLRPAPDRAEKKTAYAAEQDRPDILKQRETWFEGQLNLDPARGQPTIIAKRRRERSKTSLSADHGAIAW